MAIMASDNGGGGDFSPMPQGNHVAVCNLVADLGKQRTVSQQYGEKIKHQVYIRWETPDEVMEWTDRDGNKQAGARVIGKTYTVSLHENAALRGDLESWRGRPFTREELAGFDISKLLGVPCMVNVTHVEKGGKTYANVAAVTPLPKALKDNPPRSTIGLLIYDEDNASAYDDLPEWLRKKVDDQIKDVVIYQQNSGGGGFGDDLDDDIPF
jgi:hypothetical protein